jgi:hypothetical protein
MAGPPCRVSQCKNRGGLRHPVRFSGPVPVRLSRILEEAFAPGGAQAFDAIIAGLARCVDQVPAEVPVGTAHGWKFCALI